MGTQAQAQARAQAQAPITPTGAALSARLRQIVARGKAMVDADLQGRLRNMKPKDIDAIKPPGLMQCEGVWTNDTGFCRRLGAILFDVSDETIDDLSLADYQIFHVIVAANFSRYLEGATQ